MAKIERYTSNEAGFRQFLAEFATKKAPVDDFLPFRFLTRALTNEDIEGEILDTAFTSVEEFNCPDPLKYAMTKEVSKRMKAEGYEKYRYPDEEAEWEKKGNDFRTFYYLPDVVKYTILKTYEVGVEWKDDLPDIKIPKLATYSVCGVKNTRRKMEDRHVALPNLNEFLDLQDDIPATQYYAVFDGHGGVEGADFAAKLLHFRLAGHESFKTDLTNAVGKSIKALDEEYCEKCKRDRLRSGSTAVVACIREKTLHIAWLGDSQVGLVRSGQFVPLMDPHKPEREDEKKRIEDLGGCVIWFGTWRVNGSLSVSRSIGDPDYKPLVSGDPDTYEVELDGTEEYICVACDGFWDVLDGNQLVKLVSKYLRDGGDKSTISRMLCDKAKKAGSHDNITVIVVFFKEDVTLVDDDDIDLGKKPPVPKEDPAPAEKEEKGEGDEDGSKDEKTEEEEEEENAKEKDESDEKQQNDSVMVQGSKLLPAEKEQPPHRLFVNKPRTVQSNVNILKTDSTPHARLPHTVVCRKPLRPINRAVEKVDAATGSISSGIVHSDESTFALSFTGSENRFTIGQHGIEGFPAISSNKDTHPSPSSFCISEPESHDFLWPTKPSSSKYGSPHRAYPASFVSRISKSPRRIVADRWQKPPLLRRVSRSVPDHLDKLGKGRTNNLFGIPFLHNTTDQHSRMHRRRLDETHKENRMLLQNLQGNVDLDTEIAITNSLPIRIKPKHDLEKRLISSYLRHPTANDPTLMLARSKHGRR